jgi:hypothetical protein
VITRFSPCLLGLDRSGLLPSRRVGERRHLLQRQPLHHQVNLPFCFLKQHLELQELINHPLHRTLKEFVYVDDVDKDVGANVRQKYALLFPLSPLRCSWIVVVDQLDA